MSEPGLGGKVSGGQPERGGAVTRGGLGARGAHAQRCPVRIFLELMQRASGMMGDVL